MGTHLPHFACKHGGGLETRTNWRRLCSLSAEVDPAGGGPWHVTHLLEAPWHEVMSHEADQWCHGMQKLLVLQAAHIRTNPRRDVADLSVRFAMPVPLNDLLIGHHLRQKIS